MTRACALALVALAVVLGGGAAADGALAEPRVLVRADDEAVAGALALALVDQGMIVTPDPADATHELTAAPRDGGWVVTCVGAGSNGASVAPGPPALVELELRHRAASLVRSTPPGGVRDAGVGDHARVTFQMTDRGAVARTGERLAERVARGLLDAGVSLAPPERAAERLCVDATADLMTVSWGGTAERCDGRPVDVARQGLVPRLLVAEALRLRAAVPPQENEGRALVVDAPSPDPAPANDAPATSGGALSMTRGADGPRAVVSAGLGALGRALAVDPLVTADAVFPLFAGLGPAFLVDGSGSLAPLPIGEALVGAGVGGVFPLGGLLGGPFGEVVRLRAAVVGGAFTHGWWFDGTDAGFAFDPAFAVPVAVDVALGDRLALAIGAQAGAVGRSRIHEIGGEIRWERGAVFAAISLGLTFDTDPSPPAVENSRALARGEADDAGTEPAGAGAL